MTAPDGDASLRIEDYALIGDLQTAALVDGMDTAYAGSRAEAGA